MFDQEPFTITGWPPEAIALPEKMAAERLQVRPHVLRDLRLRDKSVEYTRIGRRVFYTHEQARSLLRKYAFTGYQELIAKFASCQGSTPCDQNSDLYVLMPGTNSLTETSESLTAIDSLTVSQHLYRSRQSKNLISLRVLQSLGLRVQACLGLSREG